MRGRDHYLPVGISRGWGGMRGKYHYLPVGISRGWGGVA